MGVVYHLLIIHSVWIADYERVSVLVHLLNMRKAFLERVFLNDVKITVGWRIINSSWSVEYHRFFSWWEKHRIYFNTIRMDWKRIQFSEILRKIAVFEQFLLFLNWRNPKMSSFEAFSEDDAHLLRLVENWSKHAAASGFSLRPATRQRKYRSHEQLVQLVHTTIQLFKLSFRIGVFFDHDDWQTSFVIEILFLSHFAFFIFRVELSHIFVVSLNFLHVVKVLEYGSQSIFFDKLGLALRVWLFGNLGNTHHLYRFEQFKYSFEVLSYLGESLSYWVSWGLFAL